METAGSASPLALERNGNLQEIEVSAQGGNLGYHHRHHLHAGILTNKSTGDAMLVSWFAGKNTGYPDAQACTGDQTGWRACADSHGATLRVNINHGEFIFVFASGLESQGG